MPMASKSYKMILFNYVYSIGMMIQIYLRMDRVDVAR